MGPRNEVTKTKGTVEMQGEGQMGELGVGGQVMVRLRGPGEDPWRHPGVSGSVIPVPPLLPCPP